jgi:hypothetical protein
MTAVHGLTGLLFAALIGSSTAVMVTPVGAQTPGTVRPPGAKQWTPPRTSWGDPDLSGVFSNADEYSLPFERPQEFDGRRLEDVTRKELAGIVRQRQAQIVERAPQVGSGELGVPLHWFEFYGAANSRAWMVVDPPDGKVPPPTQEARARQAALAAARQGRGPADSWEDLSLYNRCITRGLPGSMMPAQYGDAYQFVQGPGYIAILYEMVHEARLIPLDGRPHLASAIRQYMGDARGRWEGNTLVVETSNFSNQTPYRGSSDKLQMIERFKPVGPSTIEWSVTLEDPHTWARPWTFAMNLTKKDDSQRPFEYACHEGNYGLRNILSSRRAEEKAAAEAEAKSVKGKP